MPYCPAHRIRIHAGSRTFVYYNGEDSDSKRAAALRNILFETDYLDTHILGNKNKAESHRFCNETSEDALTWNVFSRLAAATALSPLLSKLTAPQQTMEPELYLWGLRINFRDSAAPQVFPALYVPGQMLVVIEAKFTSGNTVAAVSATQDIEGDKPKSRAGILDRYSIADLPVGSLRTPPTSGPFYAQLYRNPVFAIFMAQELGVPWTLLSLVNGGRFSDQQRDARFRDPTPFIRAILPVNSGERFRFYSWEQLHADHVANSAELNDLADYMCDKSANGVRAFTV